MDNSESIQDCRSKIEGMIERHKLVENLVHRQGMQRHDLVESMLHQSNLSELQRLISKLGSGVIVSILESSSTDHRKILWHLASQEQKKEILVLVSDAVKAELISEIEHTINTNTHVFALSEAQLRRVSISDYKSSVQINPLWVDLVAPKDEQLVWVKEVFGVSLSGLEESIDVDSYARFYEGEHGEVYLHSAFLLDGESEFINVAVTYILSRGTLFSIRSKEVPESRLQRLRSRVQAGYISDAKDLLLDFYDADVDCSASTLEKAYTRLDEVGKQIFRSHITNEQATRILTAIAVEEDINGLIRRNLLDTRNALSFLRRQKILSPTQHEDVRETLLNIESLDGHTTFLFNKINFQMDATVGFLNVNQNQDLKRLTIISVVFVPLNIVAGIGGMSEFSMMTRSIPWPVAYSAFVIAMVGIGVLTYSALRHMENSRVMKDYRMNKSSATQVL